MPRKIESTVEMNNKMLPISATNSGNLKISWSPDPSYVPNLQETARLQGRTVENVCQDVINWAWGEGWFYNYTTDITYVPFRTTDMDWLRDMFGKESVTSEDILNCLRSVMGERESKKELANADI